VLSGDWLSVRLDEPAEAAVMINVVYALEPDYRRRLWPVLAAALEPGGLLVFTGGGDGLPAPHPLRELQSRQVGRHTYTVLTETVGSDGEACRTRYLYRIAEGGTVLSEEQLTGCSYHSAQEVLRDELAAAGFSPAQGDGDLLAGRRA
jgi:hypothetical protein